MMTFFYLVLAAVMGWLGWRMFQQNHASFSRENLGKSIFTLGILALLLILVVAVCLKLIHPG